MPKITISNQGQKVVSFKINNDNNQTVLTILQENDISWKHACGGKGKCTSCRCTILEGTNNLAERTQTENAFLEAGRIQSTERMACQAIALGDVVVEVPEKCKLPDVNYTN